MLEVAVIALRWIQYGGAVVLLGAPLFLLYSFRGVASPDVSWARPTLIAGALVVTLGSLAGLVMQTAVMAGSLTEAIKPSALTFMVTGTALGKAYVVRAAAGLLSLVLMAAFRPGRTLWLLTTGPGLIVTASFAWTGHGAATVGPGGLLHLVADILHAMAASVWLGALVALLILVFTRSSHGPLHSALAGFASVGSGAVATLVVTGLVNSSFLIGAANLSLIWTTLYGQLLIAKVILFALMLVLAADNRFRLTPALGLSLDNRGDPISDIGRLRRSIVVETTLGAVVLALVAVMGTLPPPASL